MMTECWTEGLSQVIKQFGGSFGLSSFLVFSRVGRTWGSVSPRDSLFL